MTFSEWIWKRKKKIIWVYLHMYCCFFNDVFMKRQIFLVMTIFTGTISFPLWIVGNEAFGIILTNSLHSTNYIDEQHLANNLTRKSISTESWRPIHFQFFELTEEFHLRHDGFCLYPVSEVQPGSPALASGECFSLSAQKAQWLYTSVRILYLILYSKFKYSLNRME